METSEKFVAFELLDPVAAKHLLPGLNLQVSRRTFAQIAMEKYSALLPRVVCLNACSARNIDSEHTRVVRDAALAVPVQSLE